MSKRGWIVFLALVHPAQSEDLSATLGRERAASSRLEWEIREAGHPTLGNIRFAVLKKSIETPVGNAKVFSRAYVSCQKNARRFAIELANATSPDDTSGLQPRTMPRLVCTRPAAPGDPKLVQEDLVPNWEVSPIGDALARGFRAFPLRECVSIGVVQEVILPPGWVQKTARVEFEIAPYNRELDAIFVTCGEIPAYEPAAPAKPALASAPPASPAPTAPPAPPTRPTPPRATEAAWQTARVILGGRTNVRSGPSLRSATVAHVDPGAVVLVQRTSSEWWRAKASKGPAFEGYIRQDRLVFK